MKLIRQNKIDYEELAIIISELEKFLNEDPDVKNDEWMKNLNEILNFQDNDGSFKLISGSNVPKDAETDFCYIPTYICTSVLMKAYLTRKKKLALKIEKQLIQGLKISSRNLTETNTLNEQIKALNIFIKGGLREFMDLYPDLNSEFSEMILNLQNQFEKSEDEEILEINKYFKTRQVFVYGTLMKGGLNHEHLENSTFLRNATLKGYDMYNVGIFPAIIRGRGKAIGELYEVPLSDLPSLDKLEGEGSYYIRKCEIVESEGDTTLAYVYEYIRSVSGLKKISSWKKYIRKFRK